MASQPTIVTGRRRQHELLRSWSGWALTSILIDPAEVAHAREAGWSGTNHHDPKTGARIVGTAGGLGFGVDGGWRNPVEVIPWTEVEVIARAVPDEVRQRFGGVPGEVARPPGRLPAGRRERGRDRVWPDRSRSATHATPGGVRARARGLRGQRRAAGLEQKRAVLAAERLGLHARALSVDADSEAGDLLELLDDQKVDGSAEKLGTAAAAGPPSSTDRPALQPPAPGTTPAALAAGSASRDRANHGRSGPMIVSKPVRLLSLAIVALVVLAGVRSIVGGIGSSGDLFEGASTDSVAAGERTPGVVAYDLDGDTVEVTTPDGRDVRVRLLGIVH